MGVRSFGEGLMSDVRYAGRQMARAPMITLVTTGHGPSMPARRAARVDALTALKQN